MHNTSQWKLQMLISSPRSYKLKRRSFSHPTSSITHYSSLYPALLQLHSNLYFDFCFNLHALPTIWLLLRVLSICSDATYNNLNSVSGEENNPRMELPHQNCSHYCTTSTLLPTLHVKEQTSLWKMLLAKHLDSNSGAWSLCTGQLQGLVTSYHNKVSVQYVVTHVV